MKQSFCNENNYKCICKQQCNFIATIAITFSSEKKLLVAIIT